MVLAIGVSIPGIAVRAVREIFRFRFGFRSLCRILLAGCSGFLRTGDGVGIHAALGFRCGFGFVLRRDHRDHIVLILFGYRHRVPERIGSDLMRILPIGDPERVENRP